MKTLITLLGISFLGFATFKPATQITPKFASVEMSGFKASDLAKETIKNIESTTQSSANAIYVTEEGKVKMYIMEEFPKPLNTKELIIAADEATGSINKINQDKTFVLDKKTQMGEMSIDLWAHTRKVVEVNGKRILVLTADQIYIAPNISKENYFTFLDGNYSLKIPEQRKSFLVYRQLGQTPKNYPNRVWTEGESSIIKVGMSAPEVTQIKFLDKTIQIGNYPTIGYIDLTQTFKAKPNPSKTYLIKYQVEGSNLKCGVPVIFKDPSQDPTMNLLSCPCSPVSTAILP